MLCKKPWMNGVVPAGCGQCMPCRINKRREWKARLILESELHPFTSFVTLTYRDLESVKDEKCKVSLVKRDVQLFMKSLRKEFSKFTSEKLRHYTVGEYGEVMERPHFHLAIFGLPSCDRGQTVFNRVGDTDCCDKCMFVHRVWGRGRVEVVPLSPALADYITGYVSKKWTRVNEFTQEFLKGREPEFAIMSNRPGIAAGAVPAIFEALLADWRGEMGTFAKLGDVPGMLRRGGKKYPLGRYLRVLLRKEFGYDPKGSLSPAFEKYAREMCDLFEDSFRSQGGAKKSLQEIVIERDRTRVASLEQRTKMFSSSRGM